MAGRCQCRTYVDDCKPFAEAEHDIADGGDSDCDAFAMVAEVVDPAIVVAVLESQEEGENKLSYQLSPLYLRLVPTTT